MSTGRSGHSSVALSDGSVLVLGGDPSVYYDDESFNDVWVGNAVCARGFYSINNDSMMCTLCLSGSSCSGGSMTTCPEGFYTATAGASSCIPCPPGLWVSAGATSCPSTAACPPGYSCNGQGVKSPCAPNTYSLAGSSTCSPCLEFSTSGETEDKCSCIEGYYSDSGFSTSIACLPCPVGSYCVAGLAKLCTEGNDDNPCTLCLSRLVFLTTAHFYIVIACRQLQQPPQAAKVFCVSSALLPRPHGTEFM